MPEDAEPYQILMKMESTELWSLNAVCLAAAGIALCSAKSAKADLLVEENFNLNISVEGGTFIGKDTFSLRLNPWNSTGADGSDANKRYQAADTSGGIYFDSFGNQLLSTGSGARLVGNQGIINAAVDPSLVSSDSETLWFSFMGRVFQSRQNSYIRLVFDGSGLTFFLHNTDGTIDNGYSLSIGTGDAIGTILATSPPAEGLTESFEDDTDSPAHLFVASIDFSDSGPETITVYVDPSDLEDITGDTPVFTAAVELGTTLSTIQMDSEGAVEDVYIDEIRIGNTASDVTPLDLGLIPPVISTLTVSNQLPPDIFLFTTATDADFDANAAVVGISLDDGAPADITLNYGGTAIETLVDAEFDVNLFSPAMFTSSGFLEVTATNEDGMSLPLQANVFIDEKLKVNSFSSRATSAPMNTRIPLEWDVYGGFNSSITDGSQGPYFSIEDSVGNKLDILGFETDYPEDTTNEYRLAGNSPTPPEVINAITFDLATVDTSALTLPATLTFTLRASNYAGDTISSFDLEITEAATFPEIGSGPMLYESFDLKGATEGDSLLSTDTGSDNLDFWGPQNAGTTNDMEFGAYPSAYSDGINQLASSGSAGFLDGNAGPFQAPLKLPIPVADGETLFVSYVGSMEQNGEQNSWLGLIFDSGTFQSRFNIGENSDNFFSLQAFGFGIDSAGTGTPDNNPINQQDFYVVAITFSDLAEETIQIYKNPPLDAESLDSITADVTASAELNATVLTGLNANSDGAITDLRLDEIRIGKSYPDVSPSIPAPGETIKLVATGFDEFGNFFIEIDGSVEGRKVTQSDSVGGFMDAVDVTDDGVSTFFIPLSSLDANADGAAFMRVEDE